MNLDGRRFDGEFVVYDCKRSEGLLEMADSFGVA